MGTEVVASEWKPPFASIDGDGLVCPSCQECFVQVEDKPTYYDGDSVDAYCSSCHAKMVVYSYIEVEFREPELVDEY